MCCIVGIIALYLVAGAFPLQFCPFSRDLESRLLLIRKALQDPLPPNTPPSTGNAGVSCSASSAHLISPLPESLPPPSTATPESLTPPSIPIPETPALVSRGNGAPPRLDLLSLPSATSLVPSLQLVLSTDSVLVLPRPEALALPPSESSESSEPSLSTHPSPTSELVPQPSEPSVAVDRLADMFSRMPTPTGVSESLTDEELEVSTQVIPTDS